MVIKFPLFPYYYANLHSSFLILENLIDFLKQEDFTGYLEFTSLDSNKKHYLFFEAGNPIKAIISHKKIEVVGISDIFHLKNFFLNVVKLPEEELVYWSSIFFNTLLYKDLSTDFTDIVKLLSKLKKEQLTGCLEITDNDDNSLSYVYFVGGNILGIAWQKELFKFHRGEGKISSFINKIKRATFNIYKMDMGKASEVKNKDEIKAKKLLQYILSYFEKKHSKDFNLVLRKICLKGAHEYSFIDPFAGEFEYKKGNLFIADDINLAEIVDGGDFILNSLFQVYKTSQNEKNKIKDFLKQENIYLPIFKSLG
ncbi:hypothetical protein [Desulfonauticus submarinus]